MREDSYNDDSRRIELRVRHAVQPPVQDRIAEVRAQLGQLAATGDIAAVDVEVWGNCIDLDPANQSTDGYQTYIEFAEWAAEKGYKLGPAFRLHRRSSLISDEDYLVVTVPLVSLALYENETVRAVYPHTRGDEVKTITDGLRELRDEVRTPDPGPTR